MSIPRFTPLLLALPALFACGDATGPADAGSVTLRFRVASGSAALHTAGGGLNLSRLALASLPFDGTNGTLTLDELWLVVRRVELSLTEASCAEVDAEEDDDDGPSGARIALHRDGDDGEHDEDDDCESTVGPFLVQVPLEDEGETEISVAVAPGSYDEVELVTGAPSDAGDSDLLAEIRTQVADWPADASLLVVGTFTPTDGDPVPFRVYFHARLEIEREFEDPLVVEEGGDPTVSVLIDPAPWFVNRDGTVDDLTVYDYDATGEVAEFGRRSTDGCWIGKDDD